MDMNYYQAQARITAIYPDNVKTVYPIVGLANEAGETLGRIKKYLRRDHSLAEASEDIKSELGDCLWYIACAAEDLGFTLDDVAQSNITKLADRFERGVIRGNGDNR